MKAVIMLNRLSIFSIVLLFSSVKGDDYGGGVPVEGPVGPTPITPPASSEPSPPSNTSPPSEPSPVPEPSPPSTGDSANNITNRWYIVMASNCEDNSVWKMTCSCLTVDFRPLEPDNWQMYLSSSKNESGSLVVSTGGVQVTSSGGTEFKGFILSSTEVSSSVVCTETNYTISEAVYGCSAYSQFEMTIIGYSEEYSYMITTVTYEETDYTLIWSRNRAPGKETMWTKIVDNLYSLGLNPHDLDFVQQLDCVIPTLNQYDEMFFCS